MGTKAPLPFGLNWPAESKFCWDGKWTKGEVCFFILVSLVNQAKNNFE